MQLTTRSSALTRGRGLCLFISMLLGVACDGGPEKWSVTYSYKEDEVPAAAEATTPDGTVVARAERLEFLRADDGRGFYPSFTDG